MATWAAVPFWPLYRSPHRQEFNSLSRTFIKGPVGWRSVSPVRGDRSLSVILLVALVAPAILVALPVDAGSHGAPGDRLVIDDPVGDPGPLGVGVEDNPAMTTYQHIDLVRVEVGDDDADTFEIVIGVAGIDPVVSAPAQAASGTDISCSVRWTYDHDDEAITYYYEASFSANNLIPGEPPDSFSTRFYYNYQDDNGGRGYSMSGGFTGFDVHYDEDTSAFIMSAQKDFFPVWPGGQKASLGDTLVLQVVTCRTDVALYGSMSDSIEVDDNSTYSFSDPGPGREVHVRFAGDPEPEPASSGREWRPPNERATTPVASVGSGISTSLEIVVANRADSKQLIQLDAAFTEEVPPGWNMTLAPSVLLDAGDERRLSLIVKAPKDAQAFDEHPIRVTAESAVDGQIGSTSRILLVTPVLDHEHNTFHIHTQDPNTNDPLFEAVSVVAPIYQVTASLSEDLPGFDNEPAPVGRLLYWGGGSTLAPLVLEAQLDVETPVDVALAFDGDATREVDVQISLSSDETGTLFSDRRAVPGDGVTELSLPLLGEEDIVLPAGTQLYFTLRLGPEEVNDDPMSEITFDASRSSFTLPVLEHDEDRVTTDGRFLPTLALAPDEERVTYVNPDKEYAFDLLLANEGVESDDVTVQVTPVNTTGWEAQIMPGKTYRLTPGNSTPFAMVIRAPAEGEEGERARFDVRAVSKEDPDVYTRLRLEAILTTGVELDEKPYQERDGQHAPLQDDKQEAPGAGSLLFVAIVAGLFMAARWRRR